MTTQEYEIKLELDPAAGVSAAEIEADLVRLVDALTNHAAGIALGPAGAIFGSRIELGFTVEAPDLAEMYTKLHDVAVILRDTSGVEFVATSAARRDDRELALA